MPAITLRSFRSQRDEREAIRVLKTEIPVERLVVGDHVAVLTDGARSYALR